MLTNTLTLEEIVDGYISQYRLDTVINIYFSRTDIFDVYPLPFLHDYHTAIEILICIYNFMKTLKR